VYNFFNVDEADCTPVKYILKSMPFKPDVILLHWVTGFVTAANLRELQLALQVPVLWRMVDMSPFTGGCHYPNRCVGYQQHCGNCPALRSQKPEDLSFRNLMRRRKWLKDLPLTFIPCTTESEELVKSSSIGREHIVHKIMISGDGQVFRPAADKAFLRQSYGLPEDRFIFFFGCQHILDPRKGFDRLTKNLDMLHARLSEEERKRVLLVYASRYSEVSPDIFPFEAISLSFAHSEEQLASYYQLADVFISPSVEDAGPMMVVESVLCGTPVVAYRIGLAPDVLVDGWNGYSFPLQGPENLVDGMERLVRADKETFGQFCLNARTFAMERFNRAEEVKAYLDWIQKISQRQAYGDQTAEVG
jgi:glycosyltransferase involved in cell wall biosynthesis